MTTLTVHQLINGASQRDAITQNALLWQRWLRGSGHTSEIFALSIEADCEGQVRPWHSYRSQADKLLYHHSLGSPVVADLIENHANGLIPVYHNVTPPHWFAGFQPELAQRAADGIAQLEQLAQAVSVGFGDSAFNCADMERAGFKEAHVVPITFDEKRYANVTPIPPKINANGPVLLFTGRIAPHKCQADLVRLLYACRQIEPDTQLMLIGSEWAKAYADWIRYVAAELGVTDGLHMLGSVSLEEMVGAYRAADCYVSLSEHEGFGMPLIESMFFDLPVVAYRSTAVTDTLGGVGVTVGRKDFAGLAQLIIKLWQDGAWQQRVVAHQRKRLHDFLEPQVRQRFFEVLSMK